MPELASRPAATERAPLVVGKELTTNRPLGDSPQQPSPAEPGEDEDRPGRQDESNAPSSAQPATVLDQTAISVKEGEEKAQGDAGEGRDRKLSVWAKLRSHWIAASVAAIVLIGGATGGFFWYQHSLDFVSTDDAFIDGRPVSINPQVTGTIVAVPVTDNQIVKIGDLLLQIDDRDYVAALDMANAQIEQARASVANFSAQVLAQESQIVQATTQVVSAAATLDFSKDQNVRYQDLVQKGAGTAQRAQQASSELQSTGAALASAQAAQQVAMRQTEVLRAQQKGAEAQIAQAQAQKETAEANLARTKIFAPVESRVTKLTAAPGQIATQAQAFMILVPLDAWVTANLKETQLVSIKVGQTVSIAIDAFGRSSPDASTASSREAAPLSACCRRRTLRAITSRLSSASQ